jgi:hypothetical protein
MHTVDPLVPEHNSFEVQFVIEKLKRYNLTGITQIPAETIQAGGNTLYSKIHRLIISIWNKKNCNSSRRNLSKYIFTKTMTAY